MPYLIADLEMSGPDANFGLERESDTHNALEDAQLTMLCLQRFFKIADQTKILINK